MWDRLTPLDAAFLEAEDSDRHASLAIASVAVMEGPVPGQDEFVRAIAGRLPLVPRYRHKLRTVPLDLGRPVWVDDPSFDVAYHIRRTALPAPGVGRPGVGPSAKSTCTVRGDSAPVRCWLSNFCQSA